MKSHNECIAMLLAGGEGRRLAPLTSQAAKPIVPFGDRYRMIDFPLNNCANSNIRTIGVLTQYCADSVHSYVANNKDELQKSQTECRVTMLPSSRKRADGYAGTADAIYQNIDYIDEHNPEHVLILSGDHIYEMDYKPMLEFHKNRSSDVTIAVKKVAWREASRFGILKTDDRFRVSSFHEKPAEPNSNLASMGIYLFRWSELKKYLLTDAANPNSSHDFGKDIIPAILAAKANMVAYPYEGYWRDVGTIDSLWEANMDLLDGELRLNKQEPTAQLDAIASMEEPYISKSATITDSLLHPACAIEADVTRSVICNGVTVGANSEIYESIIMPGARIGRNVTIHRAIIGEGAIIHDGAFVGQLNDEISVVGPGEAITASSSSLKDYSLEPLTSLLSEAPGRVHSNMLG
ncbi:glucose-1-phosphate adenylyltransferase [Paenibacillus endophyticus]|uniref:Glucose-1-phosphate adenylyltransferase n=2 Tax=Paenibacillus endophyticus TaxID=1294268 RepID=A0A7W5C4W7_9BACL|nr:sugar phosphate nucleotidyltransferase [Paenibacillus endophyticus]MBB3151250.1 glucose-1-phosphate adenylyltransferase [Paenibacillus endophyticus]